MRLNAPWLRSETSSTFDDGGPKPPKQNRRPKAPAIRFFERANASGARVQHRDGAAVLRTARDVIAHRDRALLAVGDGPHPLGVDAARRHERPNRLGTAGGQDTDLFVTG